MRRLPASGLIAVMLTSAALAQVSGITLPIGTSVPLVTVVPLSSKTSTKGDMVALRTAADVVLDGRVVIPRNTDATGQVALAQATGGLGTSGKLVVRPLYLRIGDRVVRLSGASASSGKTRADLVAGIILLTPILSGRSATIPAGSPIAAVVEKTVILPLSSGAQSVNQ